MKYFGVAASLLVLGVFGGIYLLYDAAFGGARCSGVNAFPAMTLMAVFVGFMFLAFQSMDWLNDWIASRAAGSASREGMKQMAEAFRTQQAQFRAANALKAGGPNGGIDHDDPDDGIVLNMG
jgi:ABC-type multidrug transport system fused ATPase/permease subunit